MNTFIFNRFWPLLGLFLGVCASAFGQTETVRINEGQSLTNKREIRLAISFFAKEMKIWNGLGEEGRSSAVWQPLSHQIAWILPEGDGKKIVSVVFRDEKGQESEHFIAGILLDTAPPVIDSVRIGQQGITNRAMGNTVRVFCKGASNMMVNNESNFERLSWQSYIPTFQWTFKGEDGTKEIYIKVKDDAGNESQAFKASIILDTAPPKECSLAARYKSMAANGKLFINDPAKKVDLVLLAREATEMMVSNEEAFRGITWKPYQDVLKDWTLREGGDGKHWVYAKFRDAVGNVSEVVHTIVIVDTQPPVALGIKIESGAGVTEGITNTTAATLTFDVRGASMMKVSNEPEFKGVVAEPFSSEKKWTLVGGDGPKHVYAAFMDSALNLSSPLEGGLILDTTPPKPLSILLDSGAKGTRNSTVRVETKAEGAYLMQYDWNSDFSKARWGSYSDKPFTLPLEPGYGEHTLYIRFMDDAGNISTTAKSSIISENVPLLYKILIDNDEPFTSNVGGKVKLSVVAAHAAELMVSENAKFSGASWQAFKEELDFQLSGAQGNKAVYVKVRSQTQTESGNTVADSIVWDISKPSDAKITATVSSASNILPENYVSVKVKAKDAVAMQVSLLPDFGGNKGWMGYTEEAFKFKVKAAEGEQSIYARFRDVAGNISEPVRTTVITDTDPPIALKLKIVSGAGLTEGITHTTSATLLFDVRGARMMKIANEPNFTGVVPEPYSPQKKWELTSGDGPKQIYAVFLDSALNVSNPLEGGIILDTTPPKPLSLLLDSGAKTTRSVTVNLRAKAENAHLMQYDWTEDFSYTRWVAYSEKPIIMPIEGGHGERTLYARFMDDAGNISTTIKTSILVETVPLLYKTLINGDDLFTTEGSGKVKIHVVAARAKELMVSEHPKFRDASWQPFKQDIDFQVTGEQGSKAVYVKVRSETQTESDNIVADSIIWDFSKPFDCHATLNDGVERVQIHTIKLEVKAQDAVQMIISAFPNFEDARWQQYSFAPMMFSFGHLPGWKQVYVKFKDDKGNVSDIASDSVLLEVTPVDGKLTINEGADYCIHPEKQVALSIFARHAKEMVIGLSPEFPGGVWEPYKTEKLWNLPGEDGEKKVYIKFKSFTLTESAVYSATITLDRRPPFDTKFLVTPSTPINTLPAHYIAIVAQATEAKAMQISLLPDFAYSDIGWMGYTDLPVNFRVGPVEGAKTIYMRFKDIAGNVSTPISRVVNIDRKIPRDIAFFAADSQYSVHSSNVLLGLEGEGLLKMRLASSPAVADLPWLPYSNSINWKLEEEQGYHDVFVQVQDSTGNSSRIAGLQFELDTEKPTNGFLNIIEEYCTRHDRIVTLEIRCLGATKMMVSNDGSFIGTTWEKLKPSIRWQLLDSDGRHPVYVKFSDDAGNETEIAEDKVELDRDPPAGRITINNGDEFVDSIQVRLEIYASGAKEMNISKDIKYTRSTGWISYTSVYDWDIDGGQDGTKTIFVKFRDESGNQSLPVADSIVLDTKGPLFKSFSIEKGNSAVKGSKVTLYHSVKDAKYMMISNDPHLHGAVWEPYFETKEWLLNEGEGLKGTYVRYKDALGHETGIFGDDITVYKKMYYMSK